MEGFDLTPSNHKDVFEANIFGTKVKGIIWYYRNIFWLIQSQHNGMEFGNSDELLEATESYRNILPEYSGQRVYSWQVENGTRQNMEGENVKDFRLVLKNPSLNKIINNYSLW